MTNGVVPAPLAHPPETRQTERLQEALSYRAESTELRYTDADGRSFNLSLRTESVAYAMTYDRTARVGGEAPRPAEPPSLEPATARRSGRHSRYREIRKELKELNEEFHDLEKALKQSGIEVEGFKKMLHRMLKAVDRGYRGRFRHQDPIEESFAAVEQVQVAAVEQKRTLAMDDVDTEYWNAENTAQRLVDFATGLYQGGDREEHLEQMVAGMKRGYAEAARAFGGTLPEIAEDTIERAVEQLEEWAEGGRGPELEPALDLVA
jgi:hypothetical protein